MISSEEIKAALRIASTDSRQEYTRAYWDVIPGKPIIFTDRVPDKQIDSHFTSADGLRKTALALDGKLPELPYFTGDPEAYGHLELSLKTALGAIANRLKPVGSGNREQTTDFNLRRQSLIAPIFTAAFAGIKNEGTLTTDSDRVIKDTLHNFLYGAGKRIKLGKSAMRELSSGLVVVTTGNISSAYEEIKT